MNRARYELLQPDDELRRLTAAMCDGTMAAGEFRRLEQLLRGNSSAQHFYVAYLDLHSRLLWRFRGGQIADAPARAGECAAGHFSAEKGSARRVSQTSGVLRNLVRIGRRVPISTALTWVVMALCGCGIALTILFVALIASGLNVRVNQAKIDAPSSTDRPESDGEPQASSRAIANFGTVARLTHAFDCVWEAGSKSPKLGDDLAPGRKLALRSGLAELIFQGGARAVLQGPAVLDIDSRTSAYLCRGRVTVTVMDPLVKGFEIRTPGMKYTDLGTEFAVLVAPSGEQELHVFRGRVQAEQARDHRPELGDRTTSDIRPLASAMVLSAHEAIRVAPNKAVVNIAADEKQFVRTDSIKQLIVAASPDFQRWTKFRDGLAKRSDLIAYYDFQADESDQLKVSNRAAGGLRFDGRIVGETEWVDGQFPGKQALHFLREGAGVRINIPGNRERFTAITSLEVERWPQVDVDRRTDALQMLLASDAWESNTANSLHWHIGDLQGVKFGVTGPPPTELTTLTDEHQPARQDLVGRWAVLAMTWDTRTGVCEAYCNGVRTQIVQRALPSFEIGSAMIGAWNMETNHAVVRTVLGEIDGVILLNSVPSAEEMARLSKGLGAAE